MDSGNHGEDRKVKVGILARYARSFYELVGNRRKFERLPMSGTVRAICSGYVVETVHVCRGVDISPRGIAIDCPEPLFPDMVVRLQSEDPANSRSARVCYCQPRGAVFRVGLEFIATERSVT
jgi:PilZ domain-containing protein